MYNSGDAAEQVVRISLEGDVYKRQLKYCMMGFNPKSVAAMLENIVYFELRRKGYDAVSYTHLIFTSGTSR